MRALVLLFLLAGCSTTPLTEDEEFEREYKRAMEVENWARCERLYAASDKPTMHMGHMHTKHKRVRHWMIHRDLFTNHCRFLLGKEGWSESIPK